MKNRIFCIKKEDVFVGKRPAMFEKLKQLGLEVEHETSTRWYIKPSDWIGDTNRKNNDDVSLTDLLFCDQPDEIAHCYYDGNLRYASGNPLYGDPDLICTREAKPEQSWYEKGELPPVGEVVAYFSEEPALHPQDCNLDEHCEVNTWITGDKLKIICHAEIEGQKLPVVQNIRKESVSTILLTLLKPTQSERDKLINDLYSEIDKVKCKIASEAIKCLAEDLIDAGWRPSND